MTTAIALRTGRSLQTRLLVTVLSLVMLVWAIMVTATWHDTEHEVGELLDAHLSQAAALLVSQPLSDLSDIDVAETPTLHEYQPKVVFQVWHLNDRVIRSATAPTEPMTAERTPGFSNSSVGGEIWRVFTAQGKDEHVLIHVGERQAARTDVVKASMRSVIWPMLLALPLLAIGVWAAVRSALKPLKDLGQQVADRRPGQQDPLRAAAVPLEAQPLVEELNRLFDRMANMLESERRFTADAAHELRTPIAAIRMQAQVAQGALCSDERDEALIATVTGCDRATRLVEQLLQLARLEFGTELVEATSTQTSPLHAVVQRVESDLTPTAAQRHQHMAVVWNTGCTDLPCPAPDAMMQVLVRNLLDNALRYSPEYATVRLTVSRQDPHVVQLTVEDCGPGLSNEHQARLGERFFRVVGSGQSGSGLGWSIIRRIARLHNLDVAVSSSPLLGGLQVQVTWLDNTPSATT